MHVSSREELQSREGWGKGGLGNHRRRNALARLGARLGVPIHEVLTLAKARIPTWTGYLRGAYMKWYGGKMAGFMSVALKFLVDFFDKIGLIYKRDVGSFLSYKVGKGHKITLPPSTSHITIDPHFLEGKRVLFVGDVHGCFDELKELYNKCTIPDKDTVLIFVGDLVFKGPKTLEVVRFARETGSFSVRGNHEQSILTEILHKRRNEPVRDKRRFVYDLTQEDEDFLQNMPFTISIPSLNVLVVHGGLLPGVPIEQQDPLGLIFIRNYLPEKFQGTSGIEDGFPWASMWNGPQHVVFGHDARRGLQLYKHATGIDTGCVYGNDLTGILIEDGVWANRKLVQVKAKKKYTLKES